MKESVQNLFDEFFKTYPALNSCRGQIGDAFTAIVGCYSNGGKVLACGNGGSASDAEHIAGEFMNKFRLRRPIKSAVKDRLSELGFTDADYLSSQLQQSLPALSLVSQISLITAIANDNAPDMIFAQQVYGYAKAGDVLIAISTSGNSPNVVNAAKIAKAIDVITIGLTGEKNSELSEVSTITIQVPSSVTFKIQEFHLPVYHLLCAMVEEEFFGS